MVPQAHNIGPKRQQVKDKMIMSTSWPKEGQHILLLKAHDPTDVLLLKAYSPTDALLERSTTQPVCRSPMHASHTLFRGSTTQLIRASVDHPSHILLGGSTISLFEPRSITHLTLYWNLL